MYNNLFFNFIVVQHKMYVNEITGRENCLILTFYTLLKVRNCFTENIYYLYVYVCLSALYRLCLTLLFVLICQKTIFIHKFYTDKQLKKIHLIRKATMLQGIAIWWLQNRLLLILGTNILHIFDPTASIYHYLLV